MFDRLFRRGLRVWFVWRYGTPVWFKAAAALALPVAVVIGLVVGYYVF